MIQRVEKGSNNRPDPRRLARVCRELVRRLDIQNDIGGDIVLDAAVEKAKEFFKDRYKEEYRGESWQEILALREFLIVVGCLFSKQIHAAYDQNEDAAGQQRQTETVQEVAENLGKPRFEKSQTRKLDPSTWDFKPYKNDELGLRFIRLSQVVELIRIQMDKYDDIIKIAKDIATERQQNFPPH